MNCTNLDVGLNWENDLNTTVGKKENLRGCLNLNCCELVK